MGGKQVLSVLIPPSASYRGHLGFNPRVFVWLSQGAPEALRGAFPGSSK